MKLAQLLLFVAVLTVALCASRAAWAQQASLLADNSPRLESRYVAVLERPQPGYEPIDVSVGAFKLSPAVAISTVFDDNIFGESSGRSSDVFARIEPSLSLATQSDRYALLVRGRATIDRYAKYSSENVANYLLSSIGSVDLGPSTTIAAALLTSRAHQSRLSQDLYAATIRPIRYDEQSAEARISQSFQRFRIAGNAQVSRIDYQDGLRTDGSVYAPRGSDSSGTRFGVRATYLQSASLAWFVGGNVINRRFRTGTDATPKRNYSGFNLVAGAEFETSSLLRGSIAVGYLSQNYRSPFFKDVHGLTVDANVQVFPTQLTTVTVKARRAIVDAGIPLSSGYITATAGLQVDHELLRQLILSASVDYARNKFNDIDRIDGRLTTGAKASYRLNRNASLDLRYDRIKQTSRGADSYRPFADNRLQLSLTLKG